MAGRSGLTHRLRLGLVPFVRFGEKSASHPRVIYPYRAAREVGTESETCRDHSG